MVLVLTTAQPVQSALNLYNYFYQYLGLVSTIGHVNEYPVMHYFGTQSMVAYKILILEIPVNYSIMGTLITMPY